MPAQRKTVTVLFCDITDSTALGEMLDPERLRALLARYFERMKSIVERHGGSVEKFIGDAVMAVFGVPLVHEDDALRAVRAAAEMRDAFWELALQGRIGVTTGEVVVGTEERLATGDAVNVAARLEQAAQPGEVLIGQLTRTLVGQAVEADPIEPLELKGKSDRVPAFRLVSVREAPERGHQTRFVGRERELAILKEAQQRVLADQRCELTTIVGEAGVGKSRLAAEFLASIDAIVVRGRCLPYGDGITYWPVVEVLKQLAVLPEDEAAAAAIRALLGQESAPTSADEIAWAFRKTLEHAAAEQQVVVMFDDIQWGEETFRDLVEHVALLSTGAPILMLCLARPELSERNPAWPVTLRLEPLGDDEVQELIPRRVVEALRGRIAQAAGGNPLFIGEMLAMASEADPDIAVPPTLQALLAARLDQLEPAERAVLERGAVEGEVFHRGAVQALAPDANQVTPRLAALVRKELIRPERPLIVGEDGFRFRHLLLRDAAYEALSKGVRADLHERYASWLGQHGSSMGDLDVILGYHLEQACRYRDELGTPVNPVLAAAARRHLTNGGRRAASRQDFNAAVSLFDRAAALAPAAEFDVALETEIGEVLSWIGRNDEALTRADALVERAVAAGDQVAAQSGRIQAGIVRLWIGSAAAPQELSALVEQALPMFEAANNDLARYVGYKGVAELAAARGHPDAALEAYEKAFALAQRIGYRPSLMVGMFAWCRFMGTTPVADLLAWLEEIEPSSGPDQFVRAYRGWSLAKVGRFEEAREIIAEARADQAERGGGTLYANLTAFEAASVERLAGDPAAAAEFGFEGCRLHEELGEDFFLGEAAASLAQTLYELGRIDEADSWIGRATDLVAVDDPSAQMAWRQVRAKVLARRGEYEDALSLAREAVAIGDDTEILDQQADAYADLAEVVRLSGDRIEAAAALAQALERYERKGNLVMAQRMRTRLAEVEAAPL